MSSRQIALMAWPEGTTGIRVENDLRVVANDLPVEVFGLFLC